MPYDASSLCLDNLKQYIYLNYICLNMNESGNWCSQNLFITVIDLKLSTLYCLKTMYVVYMYLFFLIISLNYLRLFLCPLNLFVYKNISLIFTVNMVNIIISLMYSNSSKIVRVS